MACIIEKAAEKYMHLCMHNMMYMTYIYSIYIIYQYLGGGVGLRQSSLGKYEFGHLKPQTSLVVLCRATQFDENCDRITWKTH